MDLLAAAEELYAVRPDEFVGRRTELAAQAKADGNQALVAEVKKLPKPTTAAWAVNMLVRHEPDQVAQVLDLGAALREAQESLAGDQLRELGKQRRQLTAAVTRQARALAADLGHKIGEPVAAQVEDTLHAAMVDADAATAVRTGMLVKPLAVTGTQAADVVESVALPNALGEAAVRRAAAPRPSSPRRGAGASASGSSGSASTPAVASPGASVPASALGDEARPELTVVEDDSRAIEEAEEALAGAEADLAAAERKLAKAQRRVEKRQARGLQLQAEIDEVRRRLAELEQRVDANEDELTEAEETRDTREDAVEDARVVVEHARKALDALR